MPPAFTSYILRGGRRGCRERIDVSCWEVNYSNSWLQGVPTIMNPSLLRGCQGKGSLQFSVGKGCTWGCDPLCCRRSWCHPRRVYLRCLEAKTCSGLGGMGIGEHVYLKYWHARGLPCIHNLCAPLRRVAVVLRFNISNGSSKGLTPPPGLPRGGQVQVVHWSHLQPQISGFIGPKHVLFAPSDGEELF